VSLVDKLKADVNDAVKAQDSLRVETLRGVLSSVHNEEIAMRAKSLEIKDGDVIRIIQKEAKKRKEAIDVYKTAKRTELAEKEQGELEIISTYLPPEMSEEEIRGIVERVIEIEGRDNFGKIMKSVMGEVAGRTEATVVTEIVKSLTK